MTRWLPVAALLALAGCTQPQTRGKAAEETDHGPADPSVVKTIGDITSFGNCEPIPVFGIGLVLGLEGTGGGVPPGPERTALEEVLKKKGVENIKEVFSSKTTSIVRVAARVPAGAKKGDPVDVIVTVPENCRTTSLRGGILNECLLYNIDSANHISTMAGVPTEGRADAMIRGHALVKAEGTIVAAVQTDPDNDDPPSPKMGVVWSGGKTLLPDRQFYLSINGDQQYARVAMQIAERVNNGFQASGAGIGGTELATARSKSLVTVTVPGAYRLNVARFMRVTRLIPLAETPTPDSAYCVKLGRQLTDPATTFSAALRLEALGPQSIPALKVGLESDVPLVRFAAAEALAYLGSPSCGEELGRQVTQQPFVQAFALTALASLNEAVCRVKLSELLAAPNPETRFGAYRALRARDDRDSLVQGEKLRTYWLNTVSKGPAQIHVATIKRPEVVLFGAEGPKLMGPFSLLAGPEFTLRADEGKETCVISRFTPSSGKKSKECPLEVAAVLKTMGELGGNFSDAVEFLRAAESSKSLNCVVKLDAMPKAPTVYDLARAGMQVAGPKGDSGGVQAADFGTAPTLYERLTSSKPANAAAAE